MRPEALSLPPKVVDRIVAWSEHRPARGWRPLSVSADEAMTKWTLRPAGQEVAVAAAGRQASGG